MNGTSSRQLLPQIAAQNSVLSEKSQTRPPGAMNRRVPVRRRLQSGIPCPRNRQMGAPKKTLGKSAENELQNLRSRLDNLRRTKQRDRRTDQHTDCGRNDHNRIFCPPEPTVL